ncbi:MAG: BolA/IbaG family iron-sulfur metabolism protein [Candidatus Azosocius agrarius]|nr:MAG: BolA/IbaG family iron-sulfur metabolism protein [Gammaproteobacteria bacterium]
MLSKKIKELILVKFLNAKIFVKSSDEIHFEIIVVDDIFIDIDLIDRHRYVYDIISHYILNKIIHAVSIKTYTLSEWNNFLNK